MVRSISVEFTDKNKEKIILRMINSDPSPSTASPATPKPITAPPVKETDNALLRLVLAALAVRTLALVAIRIPATYAGANFYFEKVADRNVWDFPLVNVAAAIIVKNGVIDSCRIACGGVSAVPRRLTAVEEIVKGKAPNADIAKIAGQSATRGAKPLNYNGFKIPLMANLVTRAIRDAKA